LFVISQSKTDMRHYKYKRPDMPADKDEKQSNRRQKTNVTVRKS